MDYLEYLNKDKTGLVHTTNPLKYFDEIVSQDRCCIYKENALEIKSLLEPRLSVSVSKRKAFTHISPSSDHFEVFGICNLPS